MKNLGTQNSFYLGVLACLAVDVQKISRYLLSSILEGLGVKNAVTSKKLDFENLQGRMMNPDMIPGEFRLRGHSGLDFLAAVREGESPWRKNTPFVLVFRDCRESLSQEARALRTSGFLAKPIKPVHLYATILSALGVAVFCLIDDETPNSKALCT